MKRGYRRLSALILAVCLTLAAALPALAARPAGEQVTVLFTHDLHSHLLPAVDERGTQYGGYARLKTAIDAQREAFPDALLLDGGDFSMGSLFQTAYATSALELRAMGAMGYDVTTFGNHEYDYRSAGLAEMLQAAADSAEVSVSKAYERLSARQFYDALTAGRSALENPSSEQTADS